MSGNRLTIFDTTLRDGEQAPGFSLKIDEKLALARQLRSLGVDIIEAGFPIASESDAEAVRTVATQVQGPVIAALARCHAKDIERAAWALAPAPRRRIHVFIATSDLHLERKLRMSREDCLRTAMAAVRLARNHTDDVQFSAEDATRSDPDFLCQIIEAVIQSGAKTINLPDTVGYSTPDEVAHFFRSVIARVPSSDQVTFSAHCHDDLGPRGGEHAGGARRRRAPGRVHDQRDRRARGQRVARRDRHGDPRARRSPALREQRQHAGDLRVEPAADGVDRRGASRRTRRSSAATRSRTKPASTRTGC